MPGSFRLLRGDFRAVDIPAGSSAVYADPPYYGMESHYNCRKVELSDLIPLMEGVAPVRALSMSQGMLPEALKLRPEATVCVWVKGSPYPNRRPYSSWEPVLLWGDLLDKVDPRGTYVLDSLYKIQWVDSRSPLYSPKPADFCHWVVGLLLGSSMRGTFVDIFSGSGGMSRAAMSLGLDTVGVDSMDARGVWSGDWRRPTLELPPFEEQDQAQICPAASQHGWPYWWDNRHQWKPVYAIGLKMFRGRVGSSREAVPGVFACTECLVASGTVPQISAKFVVRRTVSPNNRQWISVDL